MTLRIFPLPGRRRGCAPSRLRDHRRRISLHVCKLHVCKRGLVAKTCSVRFVEFVSSNYAFAARQRDAGRRALCCCCVAGVLAACGHAPQLPNRPSLSWLCEYLKHWLPFFIGAPPMISACAEPSMAPKAIIVAAIVNLCMITPSLLVVYAPLMVA